MIKLIKKLKGTEYEMKLREKFYPKYDSNPTYSPRHLLEKAMKSFRD